MGVSRVDEERLDAVERRLDLAIDRYTLYVGLAIGLALTLFIVDERPVFWWLVGALVLATVVWCALLVTAPPAWVRDRSVGPVYMTGLLAFMAALVYASPLFAFMAIGVYSHAFIHLQGRWRFVAVVVAAALTSYSQVGGRFTEITPLVAGGLGVLVIANAVLAGGFTYWGCSSPPRATGAARPSRS